jgi:bifunctional non-homologous end joining protein LigD
MPLIEVARTKTKPEALDALEVWKSRHPSVVALLHPADVLVDGMRGSSSLWYRVRVNLQHVPEADRPLQEDLIADYDPWAGKVWPGSPGSGR